jgi:hypothetical protein
MYRIDLIFSYWIFAWFLLYYFKIINYNPKLALIISLIENIFLFILMIIYKVSHINLISFIIINFFIKVLPLYYVWNTKIILYNDIFNIIILLIIYLIWCFINRTSIIEHQYAILQSLIHNKSETPFLYLINRINDFYKKYIIH